MLQVVLFCEYPFERPTDAEDPGRNKLVLERVLNVDFSFPEGKILWVLCNPVQQIPMRSLV